MYSSRAFWVALCSLASSACAGKGAAVPNDTALAHREATRLLSPAEIAARATPAIVTVRAGDSLGTGFVVRKDGWIATNFHVVRGAMEASVVFSNHREFPVVEIVNANRAHDLVVLRIEAKDLPVLTLGDSDAVRPGDSVLAIGHPMGLEDTVSNGLISAVRNVDDDLRVLQISAPIAPGSSGGPLFNDRGEVIGVATAILASGQNLNFGLPSNYVTELVAEPRPVPMALFAAAMLALQQRAAASRRAAHPTPHVPSSAFKGCTAEDKQLVTKTLHDAIEIGTPLYNDGKLTACHQLYAGAAEDLELRLGVRCTGPKRVFADARKRAAKLGEPGARAWALRDSFDGVLQALERSRE